MIKASNGVFSAMICGGTVVTVQKIVLYGEVILRRDAVKE
jgi:hypothetical protein